MEGDDEEKERRKRIGGREREKNGRRSKKAIKEREIERGGWREGE